MKSNKKVSFNENFLNIDEASFELEYLIKEVKIINELIIIIYDFDEKAPKYRQFKNCVAYNFEGKLIWVAEHPTNTTSDFYMNFIKGNKIGNFAGFTCELDFKTGKLIKAVFTK